MKHLILIAFLTISILSFSQNDNGSTMQAAGQSMGRLRVTMPSTDQFAESPDASGSPFFLDRWMKSTLVLMDGKTQVGLLIKLDLFENKVYFLDESGNENISTTPIREVILIDTLNQGTYRFIHSTAIKTSGAETGWYQLLCAGNVQLYKKIIKALPRSSSQPLEEEIKPLETSVQFFLLINENLLKIKKVKDIPELIGEKKTQLQEYSRSKNLNGKSEKDMIELVEYYNSLK